MKKIWRLYICRKKKIKGQLIILIKQRVLELKIDENINLFTKKLDLFEKIFFKKNLKI